MAGFRQIHTKIWKDPWFLDLPSDHKLLFIYLFSNEQANLMGLYQIALKVICFETDLDRQTVEEALAQFAKNDKVEYEGNWIWIIRMFRYNANNPSSPKTQAHIRKTLEQVPDIPLKTKLIQYYSEIIPLAYPMDTPCIPVPQEQEQEQEHDQEQEQKKGADAPLAPADKPPKRGKRTKKPKTKDPPPPAISRYRTAAHLFPEKSLWPGIVQVVGDEPKDLDRWQKVCTAWVAMGWNKRNVKGMLQHFSENRIPGDDGRGQGQQKPGEAKSAAAIRNWAEKAGVEWQPTQP